MKKIFLILSVLISAICFGQPKTFIRGDSIFFVNTGSKSHVMMDGTLRVADTIYSGKIQFRDGNQAAGKVMTSDANGNISLQAGGAPVPPNIGSGYRVYSPQVPGFKTFLAGYGILIDSATANSIKSRIDTLSIATIAQTQHRIDSLSLTSNVTASQSILKTSNNLTFLNDSSSFVNNSKIYGYDGVTKGWKDALKIVLTDPQNKDAIYYKSSNNTWINYSGLTKKMQFITGVTANAPENGDSILINSAFIDKQVDVFVAGAYKYDGVSANGIQRTHDTIIFHPPLLLNQQVIVLVTDSALTTSLALVHQTVWSPLTFAVHTSGFTHVDSVYSASGSGWDQSGLADQFLVAGTSGLIRYKYQGVAPSGQFQTIGFKTANTNGNYTTMDFGAMINPTTLYAIVGGSLVATGYTATVGDYIAIRRNGVTGVLTIEKSTDGATFSVLYTFSGTSTANLYITYNILDANTGYYPFGFNVQ